MKKSHSTSGPSALRVRQIFALRLFIPALALCASQLCFAQGNFGGTLVTPRANHSASRLLNGRVLLAGGGIDVSPFVTDKAEVYNPATNSWQATGSLNQARYLHSSVLLGDGRVLIAGGAALGTVPLSSAELYDPATGQWTFTTSMSVQRLFFDPVVLPDGKVLAAGGASPSMATAGAELYDPATGTWSPTGSLLQPRASYRATLLQSGKVLIAGGFGLTGAIAESELYDPVTATFSATGSLVLPRGLGTIQILLADGRVLYSGGAQDTNHRHRALAEAEIYDPDTGLWTVTGSMKLARYGATANLLPNGKVFLAGGQDSSFQFIDRIEEYDPASGTWHVIKTTLAHPRGGHTTTTLLDGILLVAGGGDGEVLLPDAELFARQQ